MKTKIKPGDIILVKDKPEFLLDPYGWTTAIFQGTEDRMIVTEMKRRKYCVPLNKFYPDDMERTKQHICHIKNGTLAPLYGPKR